MTNVAKLKDDPPPPASLAAAMAIAFGEIEGATKSANNPHFKTRYADLTAVIEAIKPALIRNGLFFTQCPFPAQGGVQIETVLHHTSGESLSLGSLFVPANKQDPQGYGSALTYARRYALMTAFGVPTEDDDGNAAVRAQTAAPRQDTMPDEEYNKLIHLVEATNSNIPALLGYLGIKVRENNVRLLNQDQYGKALDALNAKLAKLAKEETNAKAGV